MSSSDEGALLRMIHLQGEVGMSAKYRSPFRLSHFFSNFIFHLPIFFYEFMFAFAPLVPNGLGRPEKIQRYIPINDT